MSQRNEFTNFGQRLSDLASRFEEKARSKSREGRGRRAANAFETIVSNLRDLFTRDVTSDGLREMLRQDARETFRFFTREIDFDALRPLPWHTRYPRMAWQVFTALAYRLSPPRRIAFALAVFAFFIGLIQFTSFTVRFEENRTMVVRESSGSGWWLISITLLGFLLFLELRDKLSLKADLNIAREIQFGLVPSEAFQGNQIQINCLMRPANTVGGDYYDIIELEGRNRVAVVVGDVSGKGMPAALLMALLQGSLRTLVTAGFRGAALISKLNEYLCASIPQSSLVTLFYGELDTAAGMLSYVNAGHNAPFLLHANQQMDRLHSTSMVLGIFKEVAFQSFEIQLQPGDNLFLFTDGISEAFNDKGDEYGEDRLAAFLLKLRTPPSAEFIQSLFSDVLRFCGSAKPSDDMTMMCVARSRK
ncbi:MAG TPA: PP2C family protein-serine/threonine phosphatase [Terriglobia bacterium]|nr:PP2C family protein-serine/threonine phosphatase [Terriglobia bacterium]